MSFPYLAIQWTGKPPHHTDMARGLTMGDPGETRTPDLEIRSHMLYPAELQGQTRFSIVSSCTVANSTRQPFHQTDAQARLTVGLAYSVPRNRRSGPSHRRFDRTSSAKPTLRPVSPSVWHTPFHETDAQVAVGVSLVDLEVGLIGTIGKDGVGRGWVWGLGGLGWGWAGTGFYSMIQLRTTSTMRNRTFTAV